MKSTLLDKRGDTKYTPDIESRPTGNPEENSGFLLINSNLPASSFCQEVADSLYFYDKVVLEGSTGSGKSTQIALGLAEMGYKVYVTQPRILAARSLAEYTRKQVGQHIGSENATKFIGYATEPESDCHQDNRLQYVTDGKMLRRLLYDTEFETANTVLIIDEVHEMTSDTELLLALSLNLPIKTIYSSATLDTERLTKYLAENLDQMEVPLISIEGRPYHIEEIYGELMSDEIVKYAENGNVVLGFVDTKDAVDKMINLVRRKLNKKTVSVLPLHGEQNADEQRLTLQYYENGKIIIATSIAETSITIPDVDVVVDGGWRRTNGINQNNTRTLPLQINTRQGSEQRRGRCGRTKPGIYVKCNQDGRPPTDWEGIISFGDTTLCRSHLAPAIKTFLGATVCFNNLNLYSDLNGERITQSMDLLRGLGAIAMDGSSTEIGLKMAEIPLDPSYARMIVEAIQKYSKEVQLQLVVAVCSTIDGGILSSRASLPQICNLSNDLDVSSFFTNLSIFMNTIGMQDSDLHETGIIARKLHRANSKINNLIKLLDLEDIELKLPDPKQREELLSCIISGSEETFIAGKNQHVRDKNGSIIKLPPYQKQMARPGAIILGQQLLIQRPNTSFSGRVIGATTVNAEQLVTYAPERCSYKLIMVRVEGNELSGLYELYFDNCRTRNKIKKRLEYNQDEKDIIADFILYDPKASKISSQISNIQKYIADLEVLALKSQDQIIVDNYIDDAKNQVKSAITAARGSLKDLIYYLPVMDIENIYSQEEIIIMTENAPDEIIIDNKTLQVMYDPGGTAKILIPRKVRIPNKKELETYFGKDRMVLLKVPRIAGGYRTLEEIQELDSLPPRRLRRAGSQNDNFSFSGRFENNPPHSSTVPRRMPYIRTNRYHPIVKAS